MQSVGALEHVVRLRWRPPSAGGGLKAPGMLCGRRLHTDAPISLQSNCVLIIGFHLTAAMYGLLVFSDCQSLM
jgi:hypothetical protein